MAEFQFKLDGELVPNPLNWRQLGFTITRDQNVNILFTELKGSMQFWGAGYSLLYARRKSKCTFVNYEVIIDCNGSQYTFVGNIVVSDIVYDLDRCIATAQLIDDNFQARVNNNKSLKVDFKRNVLKDLNQLQPDIEVRQLSLPIFNINFRTDGYFLEDAFQFILNFITDNKVTFQSQFLSRPENRTIMITLGRYLRFFGGFEFEETNVNINPIPPDAPSVVLTFEDLFNTITRKLGLVGAFIGNKFVLEDYNFFDSQPVGLQLFNQSGVKLSFNTDEIYSAVQLGAEPFLENWQCTGRLCNNYQRNYFGFKNEEYWFDGNCNIDRKLVLLTTNIVFDTNVIEDVINNGNETFDSNVFVIKCRPTPIIGQTYVAETDNPLEGLSSPYFNAYFRNNEAMNRRFGGYIPSVAATVVDEQIAFNNNDGLFSANYLNNDPSPQVLSLRNNDLEFISYRDLVGNYYPFRDVINNPIGALASDGLWTCPIDGYYTLNAALCVNDVGLSNPITAGQSFIALARINPEGGFDGYIANQGFNLVLWGSTSININHSVSYVGYFQKGMKVGVDYLARQSAKTINPIRVRVNLAPTTGSPVFFNCTLCQKDVDYLTQQPATFDNSKPAILEFERPLSFSDAIGMVISPEKQIEVSSDKLTNQLCQIKTLSIDSLETLNTKFTLMTTIPQ